MHTAYQLFGTDSFLFCPQHYWRSMGVVGTNVVTLMAAHFLETRPNIRLNVFHQMAQMDRAVGVGKRTGDEDGARARVHGVLTVVVIGYGLIGA